MGLAPVGIKKTEAKEEKWVLGRKGKVGPIVSEEGIGVTEHCSPEPYLDSES